MEQIRPIDLSTTPPPMENSEENTQHQIGNYILVHQIQYLIQKPWILNFHEIKNDLIGKNSGFIVEYKWFHEFQMFTHVSTKYRTRKPWG